MGALLSWEPPFSQWAKTVAQSLCSSPKIWRMAIYYAWQEANSTPEQSSGSRKAHVRTHHCPRHLDVQSQVSQLLPSVANSLLLTSTWRHMSWNRTTGDDMTKENVRSGFVIFWKQQAVPFPDRTGFALIEGQPSFLSPPQNLNSMHNSILQKKKKKNLFFSDLWEEL